MLNSDVSPLAPVGTVSDQDVFLLDSDPLSGIITPSGYRFFDNSTLTEARVCLRRFYFKAVRHIDTEGQKPSLEFGSSWHSSMDQLWSDCCSFNGRILANSLSPQEVIKRANDAFRKRWNESSMPEREEFDLYPRTPGRAAEMLIEYYSRYGEQLGTFNLLEVERPFIIPLTDDSQKLMYIGKLDKVTESFNTGEITPWDHKTAANFGKTWVESFSPNSQFDGYHHAGKMLWGPDFNTIYIDGAVVQKTKIDFMRIPLMRQQNQIEAWLWETLDLISLIQYHEAQLHEVREQMRQGRHYNFLPAFPKNTCSCTSFYGCCPYLQLCQFQNNPEEHEIQDGFCESHWKPFEIEENSDGTFKVQIKEGE